ncbi:hypothetical protein [Sphingorhabdus sp. M41]|uniref:hypothetical protein n=1 Tax=Sphingorhabdus sp. M41 TaxID=1806885 RepID=UPI00078B51F2|nr:hypothetical protein [Sphingorhabdus sp. M41]AMO72593.1 hypothetical protein AZE99_12695 [Sphingorhabdus sp. M41]
MSGDQRPGGIKIVAGSATPLRRHEDVPSSEADSGGPDGQRDSDPTRASSEAKGFPMWLVALLFVVSTGLASAASIMALWT